MRVLIAPQEFKGSLSADEAAAAIAKGIRLAKPDWQCDVLPMSDGGPGLLDAMGHAVRADSHAAVVRDPLGNRVLARYIWLGGTNDVVVEAAQANGLWRLLPDRLDALNASTEGVGDLVRDAASLAPRRIIVGVGGSATTDGGSGMARALGARLADANGREIAPGGSALSKLATIRWLRPSAFDEIDIAVATDVTNPLLGPNGAAAVYGPQKGASPEQVAMLEAGLANFARVVERDLGVDIHAIAGGGAAGGLAAGLVAFLGARVVSGFDVVAELTRLPQRLAAADIVITGEGRFDSQSLQGKVTGRIANLAKAAGKRVVVFVGRIEAALEGAEVRELGREQGMSEAAVALAEAVEAWARESVE
jgi:glycerate 2-kinase